MTDPDEAEVTTEYYIVRIYRRRPDKDGHPASMVGMVEDIVGTRKSFHNSKELWKALTETLMQNPPFQTYVNFKSYEETIMDRLHKGEALQIGQELISANAKFTLKMQSDNNLVLYRNRGDGTPIWSSNTVGSGGSRVIMQEDGNLVIYTPAGQPVWASNTAGYPGAQARLKDDGSFVVLLYGQEHFSTGTAGMEQSDLKAGEKLLWGPFSKIAIGSGIHPLTSLVSPNQMFILATKNDGNLVLYRSSDRRILWETGTAGKGSANAVLQADGNFVIYKDDNTPIWATNTAGHPGAIAQLQDDGNFVIYQSSTPLWATGTAAEHLIKQQYNEMGGSFSELGLPIDENLEAIPYPIIKTAPTGEATSDFRGGRITVKGIDPPLPQTFNKVRIIFVGLECRVRQEKEDEIFGSIGIVIPSRKELKNTFHFPEGMEFLNLGKDGSRVVSIEADLYDDTPADIVLSCYLLEHDSGDIEKYKQKIAEALEKAVKAGLTVIGVPAEASAADQGFIGDITLGVVNELSGWVGADDDRYTSQAVRITGQDILKAMGVRYGEIANLPYPFSDEVLVRKDNPGVKLEYNVGPVVVSGTDQGGDRGEYAFYFRVIPYRTPNTP